MTDFMCMPSCIECRTADYCAGPSSVHGAYERPHGEVPAWLPDIKPPRKPRDPYPNDSVILPCGCWGLPWPLVHTLGENFDEIFCEAHGWLKLTKTSKERMKKTATQQYAHFLREKQGTLFDDEEPPF